MEDQNRSKRNSTNSIITEDGQNNISLHVDNQNIPPDDGINGETPHSVIRKKELVKNRKLNIKKK